MRWIKKLLLDLLFPEKCLKCGQNESLLCGPCLENLVKIDSCGPACFYCGQRKPKIRRTPAGRTCRLCAKKTAIYAFFSPFLYHNDTVKEAIHLLKYKGAAPLANPLGELLFKAIIFYSFKLPKNSLLVPIPLHPSRLLKRGFNQSELIARHLSIKTAIEMQKSQLIRPKFSRPQTELFGKERKTNVEGVFAVTNKETVKNKNIILLDDVKTTGSTLEEAAKTLKKAGAKRIWAVTVAH